MGDGGDHRDDREQPLKRLAAMLRGGPKIEWRQEPGPDCDLRQYRNGRPTGLVARVGITRREVPPVPETTGLDVRLVRHRSMLVVEEHGPLGRGRRTVLQVPIHRCASARLTTEPGLPGAELLCLTLFVRLGRVTVVPIPLWFPPRSRAFLQGLVDEVGEPPRTRPVPAVPGNDRPPPSPAEVPTVVPLPVRRAPSDPDWVVFLAADAGEVLVPEPGHEEVRNAEQG